MAACTFFTFYSFKGGVGRSMALLNCAQFLAASGRRVLMIDMDLEAPGLSYLIKRLRDCDANNGSTCREEGLVELVRGFAEAPESWPLGEADHPERLEPYLIELAVPPTLRLPGVEGRLALLPAGKLDHGYAGRLARWHEPPLEALRERWAAHLRGVIERLQSFDYVLIDARTGFSDEGYLAVRILADHLVVLSGLNDQNLAGTARFLRQAQTWNEIDGRGKRRVILVASPVPEWEDDRKAQRRKQAEEVFQRELGEKVGFSHALPYHPRLALEETVIVADLPDSGLASAYRRLVDMMRDLAADSQQSWLEHLFEALNASDEAKRELPEKVLADLNTAWREVSVLAPDLARQLAPLVASHFADFANTMRVSGATKTARRGYQESLEIFRELGDRQEIAIGLFGQAKLDLLQGDYAAARRGYQESLGIFRELGDRQRILVTELYLAALEGLAETSIPLERIGKALSAVRDFGDPHLTLRGENLLAELLLARGEMAAVVTQATATIEAAAALGLRGIEAEARAWRAIAEEALGQHQAAREDATRALEFFAAAGVRHHPQMDALRALLEALEPS